MNKLVLSPNQLVKLQDRGNMNKLLYITAILLAIVSCSPQIEQVGTPFVAGQEVALSASMPGRQTANHLPGKQRISGKDTNPSNPSEGEVSLSWDEGDQVLVTVGGKSAVFTLESGEGTKQATFRGIMPADGTSYSVSYPVNYTEDVLTIQPYVENGFGKGLMKMSTKTNGTIDDGFTLSADNALLGLQLTGDVVISKIVITNKDNHKTYTLDCSAQEVRAADGRVFYIVLPAGTWSKGMKVEVYNTDGVVIETKEKHDAITFSANNAMVMPEVEVYNTMEFEVNGVKFKMVFVEGGTFMMGAADDDTIAEADEKPQHQVTVSDFMIGQTEVTQALWKAVMGSNPSTFKGDKLPVENVTWAECQTFVAKLSQLTGYNFRLPTEAEWEYAARGGSRSKGYKYAGSNDLNAVAWTNTNSSNKTHNIGAKLPNELGIYDMSGNVWELCQDWYGPYSAEAQVNPQGPESYSEYHVCRGGGYDSQGKDVAVYYRVVNRGKLHQTSTLNHVGLRLVLDTHQYVDLGLSVLWATCNVGASRPEEYGDYFAWGETEAKQNFSWEIYKWCNGTKSTITKYNATDGLTTLLPEDDAAHVNWGGQWRMPTKEELTELREQCTWEWVTINGIKGNKVTGPNGNSIFLPAGGSYNTFDDQLNSAGVHGWIYSSTKSSVDNQAQEMGTSSSGAAQTSCSRCLGLNIRPVLPKN